MPPKLILQKRRIQAHIFKEDIFTFLWYLKSHWRRKAMTLERKMQGHFLIARYGSEISHRIPKGLELSQHRVLYILLFFRSSFLPPSPSLPCFFPSFPSFHISFVPNQSWCLCQKRMQS